MPELFGMARSPSKLASLYLVAELLNGTECFLVGLEELKELLEQLIDVLIDPVAVLKLDH